MWRRLAGYWCYWLPESVSTMVTSLISSSLGVLARMLSSRAGPRYSSRRGTQPPALSSSPRYTSGLQGAASTCWAVLPLPAHGEVSLHSDGDHQVGLQCGHDILGGVQEVVVQPASGSDD